MNMLRTTANSIKESSNHIKLDGVLFEQSQRRIIRDTSTYELEPRVSELLSLLCSTTDILSRESILNQLWGSDGSDEALTQAISKLRSALGDTARPYRIIETVPKHGYRLLTTPETVNTKINLQNRAHVHTTFGKLFSKLSNTRSHYIGGITFVAVLLFLGLSLVPVQEPKNIEIEFECPDHLPVDDCISMIEAIDLKAR